MPGYGTGMSIEEVAAAIANAGIPAPSKEMPPATALDGKQGSSIEFARADHTHAARVQRTVVTTLADGTYLWTFARPIVCPAGKLPPITYMVEDTGSPVVVQIVARTFTNDAAASTDTHTAVTVRAQRSRALPATLLSLAALVSFDVFGIPAAGTKVNLWAADPTQ
ncbi:hypothetical protein AX289_31450 [Methylorubrum populi]|nr:hypothetical protein AX289_31450 [Methylorubrum populi]